MKHNLFTLIAVLLLSLNAVAETSVPPLINYQGTLTDANGAPQGNTSKKLEFNLYDQAGALVWGPQVFNSVPVINGQFNVILGTTDTEGRAITDAFTRKDRFLGIKVDDGTEISPRQQILSTPFAVQSENSQFVKNRDLAAELDVLAARLERAHQRLNGIQLAVKNTKVGDPFGCGGEDIEPGNSLWVMHGSRDGTSCAVHNINYYKELNIVIPGE